MSLYALARPLLFMFEPERAHHLAFAALKAMPARPARHDARLAVEVAGLRFPSPIGLAAGLDKDALAPDAFLALGFGFVEVGTVTPLPQAGNPKPRLFRLAEDAAIINRRSGAGLDAATSARSERGRNAAARSSSTNRRLGGSCCSTAASTIGPNAVCATTDSGI